MLPKVLWIEDGADTELFNMLAPIYVAGLYDLTIAADASEAVESLRTAEYAVVIVDIRLPPGREQGWIEIYKKYHENRDAARLGLHLLRALFAPTTSSIRLEGIKEEWVPRTRFAVFSVETDLKDELDKLEIPIYELKNANTPRTKVLDIIKRILADTKN